MPRLTIRILSIALSIGGCRFGWRFGPANCSSECPPCCLEHAHRGDGIATGSSAAEAASDAAGFDSVSAGLRSDLLTH